MFLPPRRVVTILLLPALVLVGTWPAAEAAGGAEAAGTAWVQPWALAVQLWDVLVGLWGENGCSLDPDGRCGSGAPAENGCSLDPSGRCAGSPDRSTAEEGCSVDPNGRRSCGPAGATAPLVQEGCSVDPSGGCRQ